MKLKRLLAIFLLALAGCATTGAVLGPTPENQIVTGANAVTATTTLATALLKNDKISVVQAKNYSAIVHAASGALHDANDKLVECRRVTGSTQAVRPDPCAPTVAGDIAMALAVVDGVKKTLDAKQ